MNGHSGAEALAFGLVEIARVWGSSLGDSDATPVSILGAGYGCGERELQRRCGLAAPESVEIDPLLASGLAWQLIRAAPSSGDGPRLGASRQIDGSDGHAAALVAVAAAHAQLLRSLHHERK